MTQLTDYTIKQARPQSKEYLLKDGGGLFLRIKASGTKSWIFRFYWNARSLRDKARESLVLEIDPRLKPPPSTQATTARFTSPTRGQGANCSGTLHGNG